MPQTAQDIMADARRQVDVIAPHAARDGVILDVREPAELQTAGAIEGAIHIPRGLLEFKADPGRPGTDPDLQAAYDKRQTVHVLCAAGARATLAAATLKRMGYEADVIEGGIAGWKQAGLPLAEI